MPDWEKLIEKIQEAMDKGLLDDVLNQLEELQQGDCREQLLSYLAREGLEAQSMLSKEPLMVYVGGNFIELTTPSLREKSRQERYSHCLAHMHFAYFPNCMVGMAGILPVADEIALRYNAYPLLLARIAELEKDLEMLTVKDRVIGPGEVDWEPDLNPAEEGRHADH